MRHLARYIADRWKHLHPPHEPERCALIEAALNQIGPKGTWEQFNEAMVGTLDGLLRGTTAPRGRR